MLGSGHLWQWVLTRPTHGYVLTDRCLQPFNFKENGAIVVEVSYVSASGVVAIISVDVVLRDLSTRTIMRGTVQLSE